MGGIRTGSGDRATFTVDGRTISVAESGRASVQVAGAPEIGHNGPVGCAGRYFTAEFVSGVPMFFRYGSQDAYLLVGSDLYYLGGAPERYAGKLRWQTTTAGHEVTISVACPPPPHTGPLVASAVPSACAVLTPALARMAIGQRPGPATLVQENPELSYCTYKSVEGGASGDRRVSVSVASAAELMQLSSWSQPVIAGLGDAAHGGDPYDGIAVRQGKLGIEVTIDRGFSASDRETLAAEVSLARQLLDALSALDHR